MNPVIEWMRKIGSDQVMILNGISDLYKDMAHHEVLIKILMVMTIVNSIVLYKRRK